MLNIFVMFINFIWILYWKLMFIKIYLDLSHCDPQPCQHGGQCRDIGNDFLCDCVEGFQGPTCQESVSHCHADSCLNGGTCLSAAYSYTCVCRPGFFGDKCEKGWQTIFVFTNQQMRLRIYICVFYFLETEMCLSSPCDNGGTCIQIGNWFHCQCVPDFYGARCQFKVNHCASKPCAKEGECISITGGYRCRCPPSKVGSDCQGT